MNAPAPEQIAKLPKWAQEHIRDLERRRETAVRALNDFVDDQSESPFFTEESFCTGETSGPSFKKKYIQGDEIEINYAGINARLRVHKGIIHFKWLKTGNLTGRCALVPVSFQAVELTGIL